MRDAPRNRAVNRAHRITVGKFAPKGLGTNHALDTIGARREVQHLSNTEGYLSRACCAINLRVSKPYVTN
jgi:hypothetical protein